jgi:RimJ/RimL family protein N-acetyltransferase
VRANSFSSDPIPQEQHLKWCLEKLSSDATRIWIMELDGAVIGQIRYDRTDPETAEIDFTVAPAYRGQGVGTSTLVLTCRSACDELGVTRLVGVVLESNVSSARAFQKAGFRQLAAGREVQGRRCSIFEWRSERGG